MVTPAPAITRCPHRNVVHIYRDKFWCDDCDRYVRPAAFVLESQPLPDELALMDFAARAARRERE